MVLSAVMRTPSGKPERVVVRSEKEKQAFLLLFYRFFVPLQTK